MHIHIVPNRNSKPAILLRESFRENGKVKKRTIANLSALSLEQAEMIRLVLQGEKLSPASELFEKLESKQHGNVDAVITAMSKLGVNKLIASRHSKQRDIILGAIAALIIEPDSKLGITRWWDDSTIPRLMNIEGTDEDDIYEAMDWLLKKQNRIEQKLAARHLSEGDMVMYDLTSSYFEGTKCPLAKLGYNRDKKNGKLQVNYGLIADKRGCPIAVSVFDGNTGDPSTVMSQIEKVRSNFGINHLVLVGDRGMLSQKQLDAARELGGIDWITALKSGSIRKLFKGGALQLGLFDERNLFSLTHEDFPGERLVACRNPELAKLRTRRRNSMLESTNKEFVKVQKMVSSGKLKGKDNIGLRVGRVVNKYKMAKHYVLAIRDDGFDFELNHRSVSEEAALDGIYIVRTSLSEKQMAGDDAVRNYKNLAKVERAFRSLKSIDLLVRPIRHRTEDRVRAHIFLCMLAFYVQWHMKEAWRPLLFADEDQEAKKDRDPVAPAQRSPKAIEKAMSKRLDDNTAVHSFRTLLKHLGTITRDWCRSNASKAKIEPIFTIDTIPNSKQQKALDLIRKITV